MRNKLTFDDELPRTIEKLSFWRKSVGAFPDTFSKKKTTLEEFSTPNIKDIFFILDTISNKHLLCGVS